ncbi:MAG TPA: hypothetical protein VH593_32515 [Ktedonobacteraceae bacterium]
MMKDIIAVIRAWPRDRIERRDAARCGAMRRDIEGPVRMTRRLEDQTLVDQRRLTGATPAAHMN